MSTLPLAKIIAPQKVVPDCPWHTVESLLENDTGLKQRHFETSSAFQLTRPHRRFALPSLWKAAITPLQKLAIRTLMENESDNKKNYPFMPSELRWASQLQPPIRDLANFDVALGEELLSKDLDQYGRIRKLEIKLQRFGLSHIKKMIENQNLTFSVNEIIKFYEVFKKGAKEALTHILSEPDSSKRDFYKMLFNYFSSSDWKNIDKVANRKITIKLAKYDRVFDYVKQFDFSFLNLSEIYFENSDFSHALFYGATMLRTEFRQVTLKHADFRGTDLRWAKFKGSIIESAKFYAANAFSIEFLGSDFKESTFWSKSAARIISKGSIISDVIFGIGQSPDKRMILKNCWFSRGKRLEYHAMAERTVEKNNQFISCTFQNLEFSKGEFTGVDFDSCTLKDVIFNQTKMKDTTFNNMTIEGNVTFERCEFTDSDFDKLQISGNLVFKRCQMSAHLESKLRRLGARFI